MAGRERAAAAAVVDLRERLLQQQSMRELFDAVVRPLEEAQRGQRLGGPARDECFRAFVDNPPGFRKACEKALERATWGSPLGMLIKLVVKDREHLLEPLEPARESTSESARPIDDCMTCGKVAPLVDRDGRLVCEACT
jgi:hypothetical protein